MQIKLFAPSAIDGKLTMPAGDPKKLRPNANIATVTPTRFSKTQKTIFAIPFECHSDQGSLLDRGFISVNAKTGKLSVEHCSDDPVPLEVDLETPGNKQVTEE